MIEIRSFNKEIDIRLKLSSASHNKHKIIIEGSGYCVGDLINGCFEIVLKLAHQSKEWIDKRKE